MPYNHLIEPKNYKLDLVYSDVVGPMLIKGYNKSRFLVTFTCDFSKLLAVYIIKAKGDVTDCFIHFKKHFKRPDLG